MVWLFSKYHLGSVTEYFNVVETKKLVEAKMLALFAVGVTINEECEGTRLTLAVIYNAGLLLSHF